MKWRTEVIADLCQRTQHRDPRSHPDTRFRYIDISSVDRDLKAIVRTTEMAGADAPSRARKVVHEDDVLVSTVRPNLNAVAQVPEHLHEQVASTGFCVLRAKRAVLDPRFLYYRTRTSEFVQQLTTQMTGASYPAVTDEVVQRAQIPLPAPYEQRRIVELLDHADALRRKRAEADVRADRILPALYRRLFLDTKETWTPESLGEHLRDSKGALQSGPFGTNLHNSDFLDDGPVIVVGIDNVLDGEFVPGRNRRISTEKYKELKKYTLEPGDILLTIMGTVGRTCVFPKLDEPAVCTKHVYRIQVDERLDPEYVSASIRFSPAVRRQLGAAITGQIVAAITSDDIRRLALPIPPGPLQDRFASAVRLIADLRLARRNTSERLERLFQVLLHRAFSGDLTARWREAHMKELLQEMEVQSQLLAEAQGSTAASADEEGVDR